MMNRFEPRYAKVTGHSSFLRDQMTGAVIRSQDEYKKFLEKSKEKKQFKTEITRLDGRINTIEQKLDKILSLLDPNSNTIGD